MLSAFAAYVMWGIFPLYFRLLQSIPPHELLLHRMVWSLLVVIAVLAWRQHWKWMAGIVRRPRILAYFLFSALVLSTNWFIYIWAINSERVVEASLGYFINPLVNVLLGYLILRERLRGGQWAAVALAAAGVLWLIAQFGEVPWVALALALTFGLYGLLRKIASLGAIEGLAVETLLLFPLAVAWLGWLTAHDANSFLQATPTVKLLLAAAGPVTAVPLLLFAAGARRIPLSLLGLMQYISPTLQLLIGVWLFDEPFGDVRLVGFALIWMGLAIYTAEGLWRNRAMRKA